MAAFVVVRHEAVKTLGFLPASTGLPRTRRNAPEKFPTHIRGHSLRPPGRPEYNT